MKKSLLYIILLSLIVLLPACKKDEEVQISSLTLENLEISVAYTAVDIKVDVCSKATMNEVLFQYTTDSAFKECREARMVKVEEMEQRYAISLDSLLDGTIYYFRCKALNKVSSCTSRQDTFTTKQIVAPTAGSISVTDVSYTSAMCVAEILSDGGNKISDRGVCYSKNQNPTISDTKVQSGVGIGSFTSNLTNLTAGTTYYVRAYASNDKGTIYSEQLSFTTPSYGMPTVTTSAATKISYTTATCGGNVTDDGGQTVTARGVCYATTQNPTISNSKVQSGSGKGSFTCNLTGLSDGTTYYVRAYATNSKGTSYGPQVSFKTTAYGKPTVTTSAATNITYTTATCGGNVTADGDQTVTARGVCYSTTQNPTISNNKVQSGSGKGSFTCNLTGLSASTTYYVRAYATNSKGTSYGQQVSFQTTAYGKPTVTTSAATNITYTTATSGGNVTADGGQTVTARGVCYSTTQNPTTSNSKVTGGSGTGSFTCNLTGLTAGTTYYVRAYATNSEGTSYGQQVSFRTTDAILPTVNTGDVLSLDYGKATCGGNVISDGYVSVIEKGICYSKNANPTTNDYKVIAGSGIGNFTCELTSLSSATLYYYRAYAINSAGVAYGEQKTFISYVQEGAINGLFSVSAYKKVAFSKGNLQYQASTDTWRFSENQWDYLNYENENISPTYDGWIDLFGWGTGDNPTQCSTDDSDYFNFVDWGTNHTISNNNNWRTLSKDEWQFIIEGRSNASQLRGLARVNSSYCLILLPDNWTQPSGVSFSPTVSDYTTNVYSASNWRIMEANGAVCIPSGCYRNGTNYLPFLKYGCWTSSSYSSNMAYQLKIDKNEGVSFDYTLKRHGISVRLVYDAQ